MRNRFTRKIIDLPKDTNEVLLFRQIRRTRARSLHIFRNSNDNNMRSATIFFENEKDLINSSKFVVSYYNNKLRWAKEQNNKYVYDNKQESWKEEQGKGSSSNNFVDPKELTIEEILGISQGNKQTTIIEDSDDDEVKEKLK